MLCSRTDRDMQPVPRQCVPFRLHRYLMLASLGLAIFLLAGSAMAVSCPPAAADGAVLNGDVDGDGVKDWTFPKLTQKDKAGNKVELFCLKGSKKHGTMFADRYTDVATGKQYWIGGCYFGGGRNRRQKNRDDGGNFTTLVRFNYEPPPNGDDDWHFSFNAATKKLKVTKTKGSYVTVGTTKVYRWRRVGCEEYPAPEKFEDIKFGEHSLLASCDGGCGGESLAAATVSGVSSAPGLWTYTVTLPLFDAAGSGTFYLGAESQVLAGDRLTLEGDQIVGAYVAGSAADPTNGGWIVLFTTPESAVFEATVDALLLPGTELHGFSLESTHTEVGRIFWATRGEDIGYDGYADGPGSLEPVPTGACCFGNACQVFDQASCVDLGGSYAYDHSTCDSETQCLDWGACCTGSGCSEIPSSYCEEQGGWFAGDSVFCDEIGSCVADKPIRF